MPSRSPRSITCRLSAPISSTSGEPEVSGRSVAAPLTRLAADRVPVAPGCRATRRPARPSARRRRPSPGAEPAGSTMSPAGSRAEAVRALLEPEEAGDASASRRRPSAAPRARSRHFCDLGPVGLVRRGAGARDDRQPPGTRAAPPPRLVECVSCVRISRSAPRRRTRKAAPDSGLSSAPRPAGAPTRRPRPGGGEATWPWPTRPSASSPTASGSSRSPTRSTPPRASRRSWSTSRTGCSTWSTPSG